MKKFRWQLLVILLTGLVVGILLIFQQTSPTQRVVSTPSPVSGGIYTEALIGSFSRLNPMLDHYNQPDRDVNRLLFNSLVRFDHRGLPYGDLAESWTYSEDGTRYTFSLRPEVYWHDGQIFTADDILYTVGLLQSGSQLIPEDLRVFWPQVQVNALADDLVEFVLPEAFAPFLDYLSFQILPAHLLGGLTLDELVDHPFNLAPIGTGPYQFSELLVEDGVISGVDLVAYVGYYQGQPFIDEIVFVYEPDETAAFAAYQAGEVDGISHISNEILTDVLSQPGLNLYSVREPKLTTIFLNLNNPAKSFLQLPSVRKALMYATNRQNIISNLLMGQAVLAQGPVLPGNWAFFDTQDAYEYDPDKAQQLLASEGMRAGSAGTLQTAEGVELSLTLLVQDDPHHLEMAQVIKAGWDAVGFRVELLPRPYDALLADLQARSYDAALIDIDFSGTPDPDPYPFWGQAMIQEGQNYSQWDNRTASDYIEQARVNPDVDMRTRLYRNFQVLFAEELPSLPLFYPIYNYGITDKVKDVSIGPVYDPADRFNAVNTWYILSSTQQSTPSPNP